MSDQVIEIDGVRYVPAVSAAPMISEVLQALALLWHTPESLKEEGYRGLKIIVSGEVEDQGVSFDEFAVTLAEMIAARVAATTGAPEPSEVVLRPLSAREERVARLAGVGDRVTVSEVL